MGKIVSNTGPLLHLSEINLIKIFKLFKHAFVPSAVAEELKKYSVHIPSSVIVLPLSAQGKDHVKILANQHNLDEGEAAAIALALQEKAQMFLTDDLAARAVAKAYLLEVHWTIGIVLRAFKEKIIDKKLALEKIDELYKNSSLFITLDLVNEVKEAIEKFQKE